MQMTLFEAAIDETKAGFRLHRFEIYNWGTFHDRIWQLPIGGNNALLTGDIGSGKSTLVDAVTTLLVPSQKITFNKAAGAEAKERSLASYIRGEYKNEKDQENQVARAIALREKNNYTVLLGHFYNEGFDQNLVLAQVLWLKDANRQVERFFVVSERPLSIQEDFSGFGSDLLDLKKRLRRLDRTEVVDTFKEYSARFRSVFGIAQEQALELFYQTISLKTVGNLTDFVRTHMLEASSAGPQIEELKRNFENLRRAHTAVVRARRQIELLTPICADGKKHHEIMKAADGLVEARNTLASYFAAKKSDLLVERIATINKEVEKIDGRILRTVDELAHLARQEHETRESILQNGGGRLETLRLEIHRLEGELPTYQNRNEAYNKLVSSLGLAEARDENVFVENQKVVTGLTEVCDQEDADARNTEVEASVDFKNLRHRYSEIEAELSSLRQRRSNIPIRHLELRRQMTEALDLDEADLPFAGELLKVDERRSEWEGAIERLLRGFALSLLVSDDLYSRVSKYVESTFLRGKLVYFRTRVAANKTVSSEPMENSLVHRLQIKPDSEHKTWMTVHLSERYDYECCETIEEFRRHPFALTRNGQVKSGGQRHVKDDRASLTDRSQYVLGWETASKIKAFEELRDSVGEQASKVARIIEEAKKKQAAVKQRRDRCLEVLGFNDFALIDWRPIAGRIQSLRKEQEQIEKSNDRLPLLRAKLQEIQDEKDKHSAKRDGWLQKKGSHQADLQQAKEQLDEAQIVLLARPEEDRKRDFKIIDDFVKSASVVNEAGGLKLREVDRAQVMVRESLQAAIDKERKRGDYLRDTVVRKMTEFKNEFSAQAKEIDASLEAVSEFDTLLGGLKAEDLPRHEERFRSLLNEGAINGIALFRNQLEKDAREIEAKVTAINRSLREIEYNPGTFIELVCDRAPDLEIRQFQQELRACTEHGISDGEVYDEEKYLRVKAILDRFNGREGFTEFDRRWTAKVTDVRHWYAFSASERWTESGEEKEYYSDSSGKSGGQKEKLAYTVLASALAYQFGLEWNAKKSRTFRFVVIDEAFGRGSDESARYGLELFAKLNLQLLVVTPLQKIHVIEDYVRSVHFIHNDGGRDSKVKSLTIDEYRLEKQIYQEGMVTV